MLDLCVCCYVCVVCRGTTLMTRNRAIQNASEFICFGLENEHDSLNTTIFQITCTTKMPQNNKLVCVQMKSNCKLRNSMKERTQWIVYVRHCTGMTAPRKKNCILCIWTNMNEWTNRVVIINAFTKTNWVYVFKIQIKYTQNSYHLYVSMFRKHEARRNRSHVKAREQPR